MVDLGLDLAPFSSFLETGFPENNNLRHIPKKKIFVNVRKDIVENRNWFCYDLAIQQ